MTREETVRNELSSEGDAKDERSTGGNEKYMEKHGGEVMKSPEGSKEEEMKKMKMVCVCVYVRLSKREGRMSIRLGF